MGTPKLAKKWNILGSETGVCKNLNSSLYYLQQFIFNCSINRKWNNCNQNSKYIWTFPQRFSSCGSLKFWSFCQTAIYIFYCLQTSHDRRMFAALQSLISLQCNTHCKCIFIWLKNIEYHIPIMFASVRLTFDWLRNAKINPVFSTKVQQPVVIPNKSFKAQDLFCCQSLEKHSLPSSHTNIRSEWKNSVWPVEIAPEKNNLTMLILRLQTSVPHPLKCQERDTINEPKHSFLQKKNTGCSTERFYLHAFPSL